MKNRKTAGKAKGDGDKTGGQFLKTFLVFVLLIVLFGLSFRFQALMGERGAVSDIENSGIKTLFEKYYLFSGLVFGFLSGVLFLLINIFSRFFKKWKFYFRFLAVAISILPWYLFARQLVFNEPRNADYARAIISYIGFPLLATVKFLVFTARDNICHPAFAEIEEPEESEERGPDGRDYHAADAALRMSGRRGRPDLLPPARLGPLLPGGRDAGE